MPTPYGDKMSELNSEIIRLCHKALSEIERTASHDSNNWSKLIIRLTVIFGQILAAALEAERIRKEASPRSKAAKEREKRKRETRHE